MGYADYTNLQEKADILLEISSRRISKSIEAEIGDEYLCDEDEEYYNKEKQALKWLCQCKNGHHFDYRNRIRYPADDKTHAPCQGKCPECGSREISMWSQMLYPIRWNFIGF